MAYGFKTLKSNGSVLYSSEDSTWTLIYSVTVSANTSQTYTNVPTGFGSLAVTRVMLGEVTGDSEGYIHSYNIIGSTLTVTAPSSTETVETFFAVYGK